LVTSFPPPHSYFTSTGTGHNVWWDFPRTGDINLLKSLLALGLDSVAR